MSDLKNKLSHLIQGQIPEYLRDSYPTFASFLEKYYEFLEQNHEANHLLLNSDKWSDIDLTLEMFVEKMREQYAYDISPNALIERKRLIKFINQYYEAKGSEDAAELFFRMMYNDNATVKYPGDFVLRASDGKWVEKKTIKVDTDYTQINPTSLTLKPADLAQTSIFLDPNENASLFDLKDKEIYLKYNTINFNGVNTFTVNIGCLHVFQNVNNPDIYELEIDLRRGIGIADLNKLLATVPYMDTVWVTAYHEGVEYTYGFLSQQLIGYKIIEGGTNFRKRDTFEVEVSETSPYPIPGQEINNGLVRVSSVTTQFYDDYFGGEYTSAEYTTDDLEGIINGLTFLNTGYRFDITGDYFSDVELYVENDEYTTYKTFERTLINPRTITDIIVEDGDYFDINEVYTEGQNYTDSLETIITDARQSINSIVSFDVGYIYTRPGQWLDNSGFISDINKLQDNYYYQDFSYVIQTTQVPYHKWEHLYKLSAHPAGFKVFGELLVEHTVNITPIDIESATMYTGMFIDSVFPIDGIVIHFYKVSLDDVSTKGNYAPEYFGSDYTSGDVLTWALTKPVENETITDDGDYYFEIDKNIFGLSVAEMQDDNSKFIEKYTTSDQVTYNVNNYFDEIYAVAASSVMVENFDRVVSYYRDFDETETIVDNSIINVDKNVDENNIATDNFDRVVSYYRDFGETEIISELVEKNFEKEVVENNGYNIEQYFQSEYAEFGAAFVDDTTDVVMEYYRTFEEYNNTTDEKIIDMETMLQDEYLVDEIFDRVVDYNRIFEESEDIEDSLSKDVTKVLVETDNGYNTNNYFSEEYSQFVSVLVGDVTSKEININDISDSITADDETSLLTNVILDNVFNTNDLLHRDTGKNLANDILTTETIEKYIEQNDDLQSDLSDDLNILDNKIVTFNTLKTDTFIVSDGSYQLTVKPVEDDILQSDISYIDYVKSTNEILNTLDILTRVIGKSLSDTADSVDSASLWFSREILDAVNFAEFSTMFSNKLTVDNIFQSDSNSKHLTKAVDGAQYTAEIYFSELYNYDISENVVEVSDISFSDVGKNLADSINGVTDSNSFTLNHILTDVVITSDGIFYNKLENDDPQSDLSDQIGPTDTNSFVLLSSKTDTVQSVDQPSKNVSRPLSDSFVENDSTIISTGKQLSDLENVIDTTIITVNKNTIDTIIPSDSDTLHVNKSLTDAIIETDFVSHTISKPSTDDVDSLDTLAKNINLAKTDSVVQVDSNAKHINKPIDGTYYNEQGYFNETYVYDTSENVIEITDNTSIHYLDAVSDTISNISDSKILTLNHVFSDEVITETSLHHHHLQNNDELSDLDDNNHATDQLSVSLNISKTDSTVSTDLAAKHVSRPLTDSFTKSDAITTKTVGKNTSDNILTTETFVKNISDNLTDTFTKSDTLSKNLTKLLNDVGTLSDNLTSILFREVILADTVTKSDSITKNISDNLSDTTTSSETFVKNISDNLADTFTKSDSITKNISDNLSDTTTSSDSITKNISDNLADTFTKSDSIVKNINSGTKTETISSIDSNAKHINKPIDGTYYNEQSYFAGDYIYDITQNLVDTSDSMTLVNEGYAGSGYVSDGYATETRSTNS